MNEKQIYELEKRALAVDRKFKEELVERIIEVIPQIDTKEIIEALKESIKDIKIIVPKIEIPEIKPPVVEIPTVNVEVSTPEINIPKIKIPKQEVIIKHDKPRVIIQKIETEKVIERLRDVIKVENMDRIVQGVESIMEAINNKIGNDRIPIPVKITNSFLGGIGLDFSVIENLLESILNTISTSSNQKKVIANQDIIISKLNMLNNEIADIKQEQFLQGIPFGIRINLGLKTGHSAAIISGRNDNISAGTWVQVWDYGGIYPWMETGANLYLSSTDATDNQYIRIIGLDNEYNEFAVIVQLNGQNQVLIPNINYRINQLFNISGTRVADVYCAEQDDIADGIPQTPAKIKGLIKANNQYAHMAIYTTSKRWGATIEYTNRSTNKGKDCTFEYAIRPLGGIFTAFPISELYERTESEDFRNYGAIPPMSDFMISVYAYNDDTRVSVSGILNLIDSTVYE